jgi:RNA 2',3'-cyclic 3'-phosphodiesterase
MSRRIRAFIAVKIEATPPLRKVLAELGTLGRAVRPVGADGLHVTLKFLGDTDLNLIPDVARTVEAVTSGVAAFEVRFVGLGAFPRRDRPSVVWAALQHAEPLCAMADQLDLRLSGLGFAAENRRFVSHLTLARVKARPPAELDEIIERHAATDFGMAAIDAVELLQSELTPAGPIYTTLATVPLGDSR